MDKESLYVYKLSVLGVTGDGSKAILDWFRNEFITAQRNLAHYGGPKQPGYWDDCEKCMKRLSETFPSIPFVLSIQKVFSYDMWAIYACDGGAHLREEKIVTD